MAQVRPFVRGDREQLTRLVNAHISAAMPGWSVPVAMVLSQLERDSTQAILDPWVTDRAAFVAVERDRVVAAAYLKRYGTDDRVSDDYRDAAEIGWIVFWPGSADAGREVMKAAVEQLAGWQARIWYADGSLPTTATYGISDAWPHVAGLLEGAGFDNEGGQTEVQLVGRLDQVSEPGPPPLPGLGLRRELGAMATSFTAVLGEEAVGVFEVDDDLSRGGNNQRLAGWADECNHWVRPDLRGRGIGTWLVTSGADQLRMGGVRRLLVYAIENESLPAKLRYYERFGLRVVNRTHRGWMRRPG
jgi:GNAT superfamily N-acetyltransferase